MSHPLSEAGGAFGRVSLMDIDRPVAMHAHPQCHALLKVGGFDSMFEVEGRRYPLINGTAVLVNAWQPHAYPFEEPGRALVLALYIEPGWLAELDAAFGASARRDYFASNCVALPQRTGSLALDLAAELMGSRAEPGRACDLLRALMVELTLRFSRYRDFPAWARAAACAVGDRRIRKAMSLIAERAAAPIDMADVARAAALSRPHFFELFRRSLGVTPNAFRNVLRMERAYRALLDGAEPVGAIAAELGFAAHAHFTRFFRQNHGVSPEAYRRVAWTIN